MPSPTLAVIASFSKANLLLQHLAALEYNLLFGSDISATSNATLTLLCLETTEIGPSPLSPWMVWDETGDPQAISRAYQAGARAVFPKETPINVIVETIRRTMEELSEPNKTEGKRKERVYRRGEMILLEADAVLRVEDGILATTMIHQDGTEVLLGLSGKGQIMVAHPEDDCHVQIVAHTDAKVQIEPWEVAVNQPDFSRKLRLRLQQMEGWAAMQARPSLPQRVLGILGLLAGQFGAPHEQGTLIDVRITHAQLAAAVGATRTSITRVLGELRDTGKIMLLSAQGEDRFCLCDKSIEEDHQSH